MVIKTHPEKQTAILNAAQKRFARFGLSKVTMEEIAADLGVSKAALYYYFTTKEEVFRLVIAREQQELIDRVAEIIEEACPAREKLLHYFRQHVTLLGQLLNLKIISVHAMDTIHPIMRSVFREFSKKEQEFLEAILNEGKKRREFNLESPEKTAALLLHLLQGLRMRFFKAARHGDLSSFEIKGYTHEIMMLAEIVVKGISK
jgi:TetR/AcrR family transcriptional regulator